jgi:hypothetical protein
VVRTAVAGCILVVALALPGCSLLGLRRTPPPPPLRVSEVVQMSRQGVPAKTIIHKIRESETVYRLSAAQLAQLHDEGVSNPVINYMQRTYLDCVRKEQRLRDENMWELGPDGYWYGGAPFGWPDDWMAFPDEDSD